MAVNVELLNKVMEHIEAHPQEHEQEFWAIRQDCGTAYCFAGHTVVIAGWTVIFDSDGEGTDCIKDDDERYQIPSIARHELGLDGLESRYLFHHQNTRAELRRIVNRLTVSSQ